MGAYKASDFVTVVDENDVESDIPKAWLGTSFAPEGAKKVDGRRRPAAKDAAEAELVEARKAAEVAVAAKDAAEAELAKVKAELEQATAALAQAQTAPAAK